MSFGLVVKAGTEQRLAWIGGSVRHIVLDASATDGRLTAVRSTMQRGTTSPVHVHDAEDETIFVLQGSGVVWVGDRKYEVSSGDTAFLPRGIPHTYLLTDDAELVTVCNPSGNVQRRDVDQRPAARRARTGRPSRRGRLRARRRPHHHRRSGTADP